MEKDKNNSQPIQQPVQPNNRTEVFMKSEKAPSRVLFRVLILGAVLIVLVILSIAIIKLVPKALSSLANVNVSISSLFTPNKKAATSTNSVSISPNQNNQNNNSQNTQNGNNNGAQATSTGSNPNPPSNNGNPSYTPPIENGPADLEVKITAIGVLDRTTGQFTPTTNVNTNDRVAMKFQVENIGQGSSGPWNLSAMLPAVTVSDQTKNLPNQISIPAGQAVSGMLYFDYIQTGSNRVVQISISASKQELRTDNNTTQITINATGNNGGGYNGGGVITNGVDLAVRIMDTGIVDRYTGQYTASNYVRQSDRAGLRFQITNQGSQASGSWGYNLNLPMGNNNNTGCYYNNGYYSCPNNNSNSSMNQTNQISLAPGESRIYVVGFDGLQSQGNNTVSVSVDPYNQISEANESNNYASANISVNSY